VLSKIFINRLLLIAIFSGLLSACGANMNFQSLEKTSSDGAYNHDPLDPDDPDYRHDPDSPTDPTGPTNPKDPTGPSDPMDPTNPTDPDMEPPTSTDPREHMKDPRFLYGRQSVGNVHVEVEKSLASNECRFDILLKLKNDPINYTTQLDLNKCKPYILANELQASYGNCVPKKQVRKKLSLPGIISTEWSTYIDEDCLCRVTFDLVTSVTDGSLSFAGESHRCAELSAHYQPARLKPILDTIKKKFGF
jgi:hypothetical protein